MRIRFWCTEHNVPLAGVPFFDNEKGHPGVRNIYTATMWCPNGDIQDQSCHVNWWVGSYDPTPDNDVELEAGLSRHHDRHRELELELADEDASIQET